MKTWLRSKPVNIFERLNATYQYGKQQKFVRSGMLKIGKHTYDRPRIQSYEEANERYLSGVTAPSVQMLQSLPEASILRIGCLPILFEQNGICQVLTKMGSLHLVEM